MRTGPQSDVPLLKEGNTGHCGDRGEGKREGSRRPSDCLSGHTHFQMDSITR